MAPHRVQTLKRDLWHPFLVGAQVGWCTCMGCSLVSHVDVHLFYGMCWHWILLRSCCFCSLLASSLELHCFLNQQLFGCHDFKCFLGELLGPLERSLLCLSHWPCSIAWLKSAEVIHRSLQRLYTGTHVLLTFTIVKYQLAGRVNLRACMCTSSKERHQ